MALSISSAIFGSFLSKFCPRFKDDDPFDDVVKTWEDQEARELAKRLWPEEEWTENVDS